jgi:hypothetical protein
MSRNLEESTKLSKDARFATLGRAIADASISGQSIREAVAEAQLLRWQEQDSASRETRMSALVRQIGDASRSGKAIAPLIAQLIDLRRTELG